MDGVPSGGDGRRRDVVVGLVVAALVLVLAALGWWLYDDAIDRFDGRAEGEAAAEAEARRDALLQLPPPSERPGERLPAVGASPADPSGAAFEELRCRYSGEARLSPGMPFDREVRSAQSMELLRGAAFECPDDGTSGSVEMSVDLPDVGLLDGVGAGTGRISWSELPPGQRSEGGGNPSSSVDVEIELAFPDIAVWVTILDGPYSGFRGVMFLSDWERVEDPPGTIVGIRSQPADLVLGRI